MTDVVSCPSCDAQYLASASATACADCGAPLLRGVDLEPGGEEVGYDLADWGDEERVRLAQALGAAATPARWEGMELVVRAQDADAVEELIEEIDNPDALPVEDVDSGEEGAELLSSVYVAADVLQHDGKATGAVLELLDASAAADGMAPPYGIDGPVWRDVLDKLDAVAELLGVEAPEEDVMAAAHALREAVRPLV